MPLSADMLIDLAHRVRILAPSHRDPERFHIDKQEIEHALRMLAQSIRGVNTASMRPANSKRYWEEPSLCGGGGGLDVTL